MRMKMALLAGSILALPAVALAQPVTGPYVGAGIGVNLLQSERLKGLDLGPAGSVFSGDKAKFDTGFAGMASVGYGFGNGLRVELEGDFLQNQLHKVTGLGGAGGHEQKYGALANVLYDIDLAPYGVSYMTPYVGLGAGYLWNDWNKVSAGAIPTELTVNKEHGSFAAQGIVGVAFPLPSVAPGLDLTLEYRLLDQPMNRKYSANEVTAPGVSSNGKLKVGADINHTFLIGLRYALYTAAPAPMAPPPPAPAPAPVAAPTPPPTRTYLVFFDWDKSDLTERARQIVAQAAANSTKVQYTRIEVSGYTDSSGTATYNQGLSVRRADSVAAELVKDGVPKAAIDVQGFGETHPLVATAAGVREPQNRRVEIVLK